MCWDRSNAGRALVAATAYMYAPYLLTNVYIRGAIAEVGAQAWLPWVFWSARRLLTVRRPVAVRVAGGSQPGRAGRHPQHHLVVHAVCAGRLYCGRLVADRTLRARLGWIAFAIAAAAGISAFFWLPLIAERRWLAETAYKTAAIYLPENVWTWRNFLDTTFAFDHTFAVPFQLGLVQLILARADLHSAS